MTAMSNYLESQLIQHLFRTGTFTKPTALAIALCTAAPTDTHTGANIPEVADAFDYARQSLDPLDANWDDVVGGNGTTKNASAITFPAANGGDWGTITHVAIVDDPTHGAGNVIFWGAITTPKIVGDGDSFAFGTSSLNVQIDN